MVDNVTTVLNNFLNEIGLTQQTDPIDQETTGTSQPSSYSTVNTLSQNSETRPTLNRSCLAYELSENLETNCIAEIESLEENDNYEATEVLVDALLRSGDSTIKLAAAKALTFKTDAIATDALIEVVGWDVFNEIPEIINVQVAAANALAFHSGENVIEALNRIANPGFWNAYSLNSEVQNAARNSLTILLNS